MKKEMAINEAAHRAVQSVLSGKPVFKAINLCESVMDDDKVGVLLKFLGIADTDTNRIRVESSPYGPNVYFVDNDNCPFLVCTDDEADEEFKEAEENLLDEIGLDAFSSDGLSYVLEHFVDCDELLDYYQDSTKSYAQDINQEENDPKTITCEDKDGNDVEVKVTNRLFQECLENDIISEDDVKAEDFDADGNYVGDKDLVELYCDHFDSPESLGYDSAADWYSFNFGRDALTQFVDHYDAIDIDGLCEWLKEEDGRGSMLNSWDGKEYQEDFNGETYYIYPDCNFKEIPKVEE